MNNNQFICIKILKKEKTRYLIRYSNFWELKQKKKHENYLTMRK